MTPGHVQSPPFNEIASLLAANGLVLRGGLHPEPADGAPATVRTLLLVGNAGPALWKKFGTGSSVPENTLDRWAEETVGSVAAAVGAEALFPHRGPPYLPFQQWAMRAAPVSISPLGMLIDPDFGLWHAYRGALAFTDVLDLPPTPAATSPCGSCADRPCLSACPVGAFAAGREYDVPGCAAHLETKEGEDCMTLGCRARRACPVGREFTYVPDQAGFHMRAFLDARRRED